MQRLVLRGRADVSIHSKSGEKLFNFFLAHFCRMALVMKENEAFDPVDVGLLGLVTIMSETEDSNGLDPAVSACVLLTKVERIAKPSRGRWVG